MNRARGLVIIIGGVVLTVLGIGMRESPEMSRQGFLAAWSSAGKGLVRLQGDPFAISGILVMITGLLPAYHGFRRLARG